MRFSKENVQIALEKKLKYFEDEFGFTSENGYAQVDGKSEGLNRAYGAYDELQSLYTSLLGKTYRT